MDRAVRHTPRISCDTLIRIEPSNWLTAEGGRLGRRHIILLRSTRFHFSDDFLIINKEQKKEHFILQTQTTFVS